MRCLGYRIGALLALGAAVSLERVSCFSQNSRTFLTAYREKNPLRASPSEEHDATAATDNDEITKYWDANSEKWETVLSILDVRAAYATGSLDGILPSGRPSRGAPNERLLSLPRALELFRRDEVLVRRRYQQMKLSELRPRWDRAVAKRTALRSAGTWQIAVEESEKYRAFRRSIVEGGVESAEASPAWARAVVTLISPALKAAAGQKKKADGGIEAAQVELLQEAGEGGEERWITAALLAELEEEFERDFSRVAVDSLSSGRSLFAEDEMERDSEDAGSGALLGVLFAVATALLISLLQ